MASLACTFAGCYPGASVRNRNPRPAATPTTASSDTWGVGPSSASRSTGAAATSGDTGGTGGTCDNYDHTHHPGPAANTSFSTHTSGADPRRPSVPQTSYNTSRKAAAGTSPTASRTKAYTSRIHTGSQDTCADPRTCRAPLPKANPNPRQIPADLTDTLSWSAPGSSSKAGRFSSEAGCSSGLRANPPRPTASSRSRAAAEFCNSNPSEEAKWVAISLAIYSSVASNASVRDAIVCENGAFYEMGGRFDTLHTRCVGYGSQ